MIFALVGLGVIAVSAVVAAVCRYFPIFGIVFFFVMPALALYMMGLGIWHLIHG